MALPKFSYLKPIDLQEACRMLAEHRDKARIFAGGTDLLIQMQHGNLQPEYIIGISNIPGTDYIRFDQQQLVIGANVKLASVGQNLDIPRYFPALAHAVSVTASVQIRNMGTIVGNICNASPSADTATPLLAYDAKMVIINPEGERILPLCEFYRGPGATALESGEIVKELILPLPPERYGSNYQKLSARSKVDIAAIGVSAFLQVDEAEVVTKARIAIGAVAPIPKRITQAEKLLEGKKLIPALIEQAAQIARDEARPITDVRATAAYRKQMVEVLTQRALTNCMDQIGKQ